MKSLGILSSGLNTFITEGFKLLNLITFLHQDQKRVKRGLFLLEQTLLMQLEQFIQTLKKDLLQQKLSVIKI